MTAHELANILLTMPDLPVNMGTYHTTELIIGAQVEGNGQWYDPKALRILIYGKSHNFKSKDS
jgi:hypothetical protein